MELLKFLSTGEGNLHTGLSGRVVSLDSLLGGVLGRLDRGMGCLGGVVGVGDGGDIDGVVGSHDSSFCCGLGSGVGSMSKLLHGSLLGGLGSVSSSLFGSVCGLGGIGGELVDSLDRVGHDYGVQSDYIFFPAKEGELNGG